MFPKLHPGERIRADLTSPATVMAYPLIETIAWTGLIWIAIGLIDGPAAGSVAPDLLGIVRTGLIAVWLVLLVFRFLLPLFTSRRRRLVVTDHRVIVRQANLRGTVNAIPMHQIHSIRRRRKGIYIAVYGYERPVFIKSVPKAKRVEDMINHSLAAIPRM